MRRIGEIMKLAPVIPVLVIEDAGEARTIAEALVAGGLRVLEVTLRTPAAIDAIAEMRGVEGAVVGAGTVLNPRQLEQSLAAGAEFVVSPGLTEDKAAEWLALDPVLCVGGSWLVPKGPADAAAIEARARAAASLR